ncbi:MAG: hypothetical protein QW808_02735 [Desulfurococcaceae archaeon]
MVFDRLPVNTARGSENKLSNVVFLTASRELSIVAPLMLKYILVFVVLTPTLRFVAY